MSCQKRTDLSYSSNTTHVVSPRPKQAEDEPEIDVLAGAQKVWRGVSKVVKERSIIGERDFNKWIADWRNARRGLDFSMESKHFFLGGADLDDFIKNLINGAENNILLSNPYVEMCYLTDFLIDACARGIDIQIVLRPESNNLKRVECQSRLREKGIVLRCDDRVHSKIIVVDGKVAVVSSMNFYSGSSGGASNEAGIVSIDGNVVDSAASYIRKFF
jgi:phosphatidylserine/phosphatidylglycerophosphate/cardiolipin synthase-like enzyme